MGLVLELSGLGDEIGEESGLVGVELRWMDKVGPLHGEVGGPFS